MSFHAPTSQLYCGHRNGHIIVWDLKPLLDFIERVAADPTANWFVSQAATGTAAAAHATPSNAIGMAPASSAGSSLQVTSNLRSRPVSTREAAALSHNRRSNVSFSPPPEEFDVKGSLPIKDQLALIAQATKPSRIIQAYDTGVSSLTVILDPPALLSAAAGDHVCHVWSLTGEAMGTLDPVTGLAKGYELSAPPSAQPISAKAAAAAAAAAASLPEWRFRVDVASRAARDRATTHGVLKELERMAIDAQTQQAAAAAQASARSHHSASDALQLQSPYGMRTPMRSPDDKSRLLTFPLPLSAAAPASAAVNLPAASHAQPARSPASQNKSSNAGTASSQRI